MFEQTDNVEIFICLLSIIPFGPINQLGSEQSIKRQTGLVGPNRRLLGGLLYGQVDKPDTFSWAQYILVVLSRICRPLPILCRKVRETLDKFNGIGNVHI